MEVLRRAKFLMRTTALTVIGAYSFVFYSPAALAVKQSADIREEYAKRLEATLPAERLAQKLEALKREAAASHADVVKAKKERGTLSNLLAQTLERSAADSHVEKLSTLNQEVASLSGEALKGFSDTGAHIQAKKLPKEIQQRQAQALVQYQTRYHKMQTLLQDVVTQRGEKRDAAVGKLNAFLQQQQFQQKQQPFNPKQMPFGAPAGKVRAPHQTAMEVAAELNLFPERQLAASALTPEMLAKMFAIPSGPTAADLAGSLDVNVSADIRAKADELRNDPIAIYTWVHNNIRFIPSYGSIQGATATLHGLQGNAIDTASLLIALLRVSNTPARYAYGTVRIPIDQVMNWVGGVTDPQAALQILAQGGVPSKGLTVNGKIAYVELEHTWVEAWVDFEPTRGVKNAWGDSWVPMDGSFKQYQFSDGMNVQQQVPFDAQTLANTIQQKSTINTSEGWVQNVPQSDAQTALNQYQQQLQTYIANQNPNATVRDVLGLQDIKIIPAAPLSAGLPYTKVVAKQIFSEVPGTLRHKFRVALADEFGTSIFTVEKTTVELAEKKIELAFSPASQNDIDVINSYLPKPEANGQIDPSKLSSKLPGYLIHLNAELFVANEKVASGAAGTMGATLNTQLAMWSPKEGWFERDKTMTAGEYQAIALDLQGISPKQASDLQAQIQQTQAQLNNYQFSALTKSQILGDLLYATALTYFALNDLQDQVGARAAKVVNYRTPSFGKFQTGLDTIYFWGVPRDVAFGGLITDIDGFRTMGWDKTNNKQNWITYLQSHGARLSAMEHAVPEMIFSEDTSRAEGVSAVKALVLAGAQGQKTYTITQDNLESALSAIQLDVDTENEIRQGVLSGFTATAHEALINFNGWKGAGYIIFDPLTGSGAYKIAGGKDGDYTVVNSVLGASSLLVSVADVGADLGEVGEGVFKLGKVFDKLGKFLGPLSVFLGVVAAKAAGCGVGPSLLAFTVSYSAWVGVMLVAMYALPILIVLLSIIAIAVAEYLVNSWITDSCTREEE